MAYIFNKSRSKDDQEENRLHQQNNKRNNNNLNCCLNRVSEIDEDDIDGACEHYEPMMDATDEQGRGPSRNPLAFKAGFITLKERISSLTESKGKINNKKDDLQQTNQQQQPPQPRQYATLNELFSSKFNNSTNKNNNSLLYEPKKPKIPVMKLNKEDWNVKCWEDRLTRKHQQQRQLIRKDNNKQIQRNNLISNKPTLKQVEVFKERIDDVAQKLDKVREGLPMDEKLNELLLNKKQFNNEKNCSHGWVDLLKNELAKGTHDPKQLKYSIDNSIRKKVEKEQEELSEDNTNPNLSYQEQPSKVIKAASNRRKEAPKSPLGRPIGRILDDDDDD